MEVRYVELAQLSWLWSLRGRADQFSLQSDSRGMALSAHMQEALEAKEQEVQRLAEGQREVSTDRPSESPDSRTFFTAPSWTGPLKPQAAKNSLGCWLTHQGSLPSVLGTLPYVR